MEKVNLDSRTIRKHSKMTSRGYVYGASTKNGTQTANWREKDKWQKRVVGARKVLVTWHPLIKKSSEPQGYDERDAVPFGVEYVRVTATRDCVKVNLETCP